MGAADRDVARADAEATGGGVRGAPAAAALRAAPFTASVPVAADCERASEANRRSGSQHIDEAPVSSISLREDWRDDAVPCQRSGCFRPAIGLRRASPRARDPNGRLVIGRHTFRPGQRGNVTDHASRHIRLEANYSTRRTNNALCPTHVPGAESTASNDRKPNSIAYARCRPPPSRSCKSIMTSS